MSDPNDSHPKSYTIPERSGAQATVSWAFDNIAGTVLAARYEVKEIIGRGGMGIVVRAFDRTLATDVAVKLLRPELMPERRWAERLAREVKLARQIHHPNVCRVFDFEQADGFVFLVMELAVGTLAQEIADGTLAGRPIEDRLAEAKSIVAGLAAIHAAGIVHGDVTPQNVLRMSDGRLVVSDFGLARELVDTTTLHGGTVAYMAPEVVMGSPVSFSTDVWSLGILIHEMVFGVRPTWRKDAPGRVMERPAAASTPDGQRALELVRALAVASASKRPRDAAGAQKVFDRHRRWTTTRTLLMTGVLLAAVGIVGSYWLLARKGQSRPAAPTSTTTAPIEITGVPEDWTASSRVLATVQGKVHCLTTLPDNRTVRFVWGYPRRAEDVDVVTGKRVASPLVPKAYAEGCPDLAANGRDLVFQGYDDKGRPTIFTSAAPDGSAAIPVASSAEPSLHSEPKWLATPGAFLFDLDWRHAAIYDGEGVTVIPSSMDDLRYESLFRLNRGDVIYLILFGHGLLNIQARRWPTLAKVGSFSISGYSYAVDTNDHRRFYFSDTESGSVIALEPALQQARRIGAFPGYSISYVALVNGGLAVVPNRTMSDAWIEGGTGKPVRLTVLGDVREAVRCFGDQVMVTRGPPVGRWTIHMVTQGGRILPRFDSPDTRVVATCSRDSDQWWVNRAFREDVHLDRCMGNQCSPVLAGPMNGLSLSPNGRYLAYIASTTHRGAVVFVLATDTLKVREVANTETACQPVWSSPLTIWVSRRIKGLVVWTEVDVEKAEPTGGTRPGGKSCWDWEPDPLAPADDDVRVIVEHASQIRFKEPPIN